MWKRYGGESGGRSYSPNRKLRESVLTRSLTSATRTHTELNGDRGLGDGESRRRDNNTGRGRYISLTKQGGGQRGSVAVQIVMPITVLCADSSHRYIGQRKCIRPEKSTAGEYVATGLYRSRLLVSPFQRLLFHRSTAARTTLPALSPNLSCPLSKMAPLHVPILMPVSARRKPI